MIKGRSVFSLGVESAGAFDLSSAGHSLAYRGGVRSAGDDRTLVVEPGGYVEVGRSPQMDDLHAFTLEATVAPVRLNQRQMIVESESPPIKLYVERGGKLVGSIHTEYGWQSIDSGEARLGAGQPSKIRFTRGDDGSLRLEVNTREVGTATVAEELVPAGESGLTIGAGVGGERFHFHGHIADVKVREGVVSISEIRERRNWAENLSTRFADIFNVGDVWVEPDPDVSNVRLQHVKGIMLSVGVADISKLGTLRIDRDTTLSPGTVMIAPEKAFSPSINWAGTAAAIAALATEEVQLTGEPADEVRSLLASSMANRNSAAVLRKVEAGQGDEEEEEADESPEAASGMASLRMMAAQPIRLAHQPRMAHLAPSLARMTGGARRSERLPELIERDELTVKRVNPEIFSRLDAEEPSVWPVMGTPQYVMMAVTSIPVNTSVIIAGTLDLTNKKLVIEPTVETLYIIAEKIVCGPNAEITWRRPGGTTPGRASDPDKNGQPNWSGVHTASGSRDGLPGGDARDGDPGIAGRSGNNAPHIEVWVKDMDAMPDFGLNGENGIRGGRGQNGGRGGDGADGRLGEWYWLFGIHCWSDPGHGGDGGDGGNGGRGGRGGNGGDGSNVTIAVLEGTLETTVTAQAFRIKNQGGQKGRGGDGGNGGGGGDGGRSGNGEKCHNARDGSDGQRGQRGQTGPDGSTAGRDGTLEFLEFTEDEWEELLTRPWLTQLTPTQAFPGAKVVIKGSRFTPTDRVIVNGHTLAPTIRADESIEVTLPTSITGGEKHVYVRRPDGTQSNHLLLRIKPQLMTSPTLLTPGSTATLSGRAFLTGASVLYDSQAIPAQVNSQYQLTFTVPGTGGAGSTEGSVTLAVRNPDGMISNERTATRPLIREFGFQIGVHDFKFDNFKLGSPSWSTYEDTFGAVEVWHELLDPLFGHPILTAAYYGFYHYFLLGEDGGGLATGFCTSMSAVVLDEFWTGSTDTHTRYNLDGPTRERLTAIHGRLLSRESLLGFHEQSRQGNARVLQTFNEIEQKFINGMDRESAPMLFFIPAGAAWESGYFDKLGDSHCIVPIRIVYPTGYDGSDPAGIQMYCWDCNHPPEDDTATNKISENCRLVLRRTDGEIRFDYFDGGSSPKFCSEDGITLGTMSVGEYMLSDHDLPFGGPLGLTTFIVDFLLSNADLQVTDAAGRRTGQFGAQILAEVPGSHPAYLAKNACLLPADTAMTRRIVGSGAGTYSYHSIMPGGVSLALTGVVTASGHEDVLAINADASQLRFTPAADKLFTLSLAREMEDEVRAIAVEGLGGGPAADVDITVSPDLSLIRVGNRDVSRNISVRAFGMNTNTQAHATHDRGGVPVPADHDLVVAVTDWEDMQVSVQTLSFE